MYQRPFRGGRKARSRVGKFIMPTDIPRSDVSDVWSTVMKPADELWEEACRKIRHFQEYYGVGWVHFRKLEVVDAKYRGLTEKHWVRAVQGKSDPHPKTRQLTFDLAAWIDDSPASILAVVPHRHRDRSAALLQRSGFRETPHATASETLAKDMISLAGNGRPKSSIERLVEECERTLAYHPDEAMAPLRALTYLSSRYQQPHQFLRNVERILSKLDDNRRIRSVDPILRGQVIAQIASYMLDHGNVDAGACLLHHRSAKAVLESSWVAEPLKCQMRRQLAIVDACASNRFDRARAYIKDAATTSDVASVRSSAIAINTLWRMQGDFHKAYSSIEKEHKSSLSILSQAATEKRIDVGSLVQHFVCVFRGSVARVVYEATRGTKFEIKEEIRVMAWVLEVIKSFPLETWQLQLPCGVRLQPELDSIRNNCLNPTLDVAQMDRLDKLVQALMV